MGSQIWDLKFLQSKSAGHRMGMQVDVQAIKDRLFECAASKIARDYGFNLPSDPEQLARQVLQELDQKPTENPVDQKYDNNAIFRAAVRALGSNSRQWATFRRNEPAIMETLHHYQVQKVVESPPIQADLAKLLPGQSASGDARAMLAWAHLLTQNPNYYEKVVRVAKDINGLPAHEHSLCVIAHFTDGSKKAKTRKWPGMGFVLGSEFLRNLRWNGFKPDRHVKRLLDRWTNKKADVHQDVQRLIGIIGRSDRELRDNIKWSLIGAKVAPDDCKKNLSQLDNIIWLLGAYVEKKNRESTCEYMIVRPAPFAQA
jgi:hypothetical protein